MRRAKPFGSLKGAKPSCITDNIPGVHLGSSSLNAVLLGRVYRDLNTALRALTAPSLTAPFYEAWRAGMEPLPEHGARNFYRSHLREASEEGSREFASLQIIFVLFFTPAMQQLFTKAQAAQFCQVSRQALEYQIKLRKLQLHRFPHGAFIKRHELVRYLKRKRSGNGRG